MRAVVRLAGWALIAAGVLVGLYLVYSLYWTGLQTRSAQQRLLEDWELQVGDVDGSIIDQVGDGTGGDRPVAAQAGPAVPADGAVAAMQFLRPGSQEPLVLDAPVFVVDGVSVEALKEGPGRYPAAAMPGENGNFSVAGHRTTYGAPFFDLDELREGDEIHVTDRRGTRWVYTVVEERIVQPDAVEVLDADPLGTGKPMLTLTTCNPSFSNRERLIVFAELDGSVTS